MNITKSKLDALKFYLSFGAPTIEDSPEFMYWCSDGGKTNFTKKEFHKLEKGAEVFKYLKGQLEEVGWEMVDFLYA